LELDAKAMIISDVALEKNGARTPLKYTYKDDILKISLDKTYQKNQDYTVYIKYVARPNEVKQKGSAAINDAKGLYFINAQGKDLINLHKSGLKVKPNLLLVGFQP
jgi:aminopeptidase N